MNNVICIEMKAGRKKMMPSVPSDKMSFLKQAYGNEYEEVKNDCNNMSYWLPRINTKLFAIPDTRIIPLDLEQYVWLKCDDYQENEIKDFSDFIIQSIKESGLYFNSHEGMFIKTGTFSNKFDFQRCHVFSLENIARNFVMYVFYNSMVFGAVPSPELVIREFIQTRYPRRTIYNGLKLNTEFRVFYDFYAKKILGIFNYWDKQTMQKSLRNTDLANFNSEADIIEKDFQKYKPELEEMINKDSIGNSYLHGTWSIDFLFDGDRFWLIDMAEGESSYFYDRL